ncbi:MAG: ATP-binding protein [Planctomycetota bacterium]|nr:ATP-binding protein [Planctomycetota bacterium]MDA1212821.1 ATP-binding protein [Planctomycetota bacterium]
MLLITGSFYFYGRLNTNLMDEQNKTTARLLVKPVIFEHHWKFVESEPEMRSMIEEMAEELTPEELKEYRWQIFKANPTEAGAPQRPDKTFGFEALEKLRQGNDEVEHWDEEGFQYYGAIRASQSCLTCHYHKSSGNEVNSLIGMVHVSFPLDDVQQARAWNNAILIATAIVTAVLAMLAAYLIVRYVIVKPVLHLKDVSDQITRGNLDLRADIRTGDEFEELSQAFNRMLRYLVTVQEELRQVNGNLDGKVDELAQVNLRLYEMNKLKDEFLATMSHELRTPLNSILGFSDLLNGAENMTEKQKRFVQNITTSGRNLLAIINDILDLAKIESGKMHWQPVEFTIQELVDRQINSILPLAEKKNIEVTSHVESQLPILYQDPGKIQQILNNLLSNAVKFTPEGGRIRVEAILSDDDLMELSVEDTGVGIPLEEQATIFEKFRQGKGLPGQKDVLTREYEGTGLGLSIIKELSKLLGGEVQLESEFGKGSKFTVRLPIRLREKLQPFDVRLPVPEFSPERMRLEDSISAASRMT